MQFTDIFNIAYYVKNNKKYVRAAMRMAYFPIFENALRSAAMPKMSNDQFFGFRMISSIDLIWFQPRNLG